MRATTLLLLLLLGCGTTTTTNDGQPGVLDSMVLYDASGVFEAHDTTRAVYSVAAHWKAYDGVGNEMEVGGLQLQYQLGDTGQPAPVEDGTVLLGSEFRGYIYLYGATVRDPQEQLGKHYIQVLRRGL